MKTSSRRLSGVPAGSTWARATPASSALPDAEGLREHPGADRARLPHRFEPGEVEERDHALRVLRIGEEARRLAEQDQLLGAERHRERRGDRVGVDVQQRPGLVSRNGAHHRQRADAEQPFEQPAVHAVDVADVAVVHRLDGGPLADLDRRPAVRPDQSRVHARQPDRGQVEVAAGGEDAGVDLAVQHHGGDPQRLRVGDPAPPHETGADPELLRELGGLGAAAVDQHHPDAEFEEQRHLLHEVADARFGGDGRPAGLDDEGLAAETLQVRRRVPERPDPGLVVLSQPCRAAMPV